jgi:putative flippase GtrA
MVRFGAAGGFITGLDLALVWLLSRFLAPTLAVAIAYLVAMSIHFCLNKFWVFQNRDLEYVRQMWKYGLTVLVCWCCTVAVFSLGMHLVTTHILLAKLIAIPPTTLLGYLMMRKFVFALPAREKAAP